MVKKNNGKSTQRKKNKGGRPPKVDAILVNKLIAGFNNGFNVEECCDYSGISKETYYKWIKKNQKFADDMTSAKMGLGKKSKKILSEEIQNGNWKAAMWWLEKTQRKDFGHSTELTNGDGDKFEGILIVRPEQYAEYQDARSKQILDSSSRTPDGSTQTK